MKQVNKGYILYHKVDKEFLTWEGGTTDEMLNSMFFMTFKQAENKRTEDLDEPDLFEVWAIEIECRTV